MAPVLPDGSTVEVTPQKIYVPGDVIAFTAPNGSLRVHRVLGYHRDRSGWKLVTKGDNAAWIDPPVGLNRVLGCVHGGAYHRVSLRQRCSAVAMYLRKSARSLWRRLARRS